MPAKRPVSGPRWVGLVSSLVVVVLGLLGGATPALAQLAPSANVTQLIINPQASISTNYNPTNFALPCDNTAASGLPGCTGGTTNLTFGDGNETVLEAVIAAGNRFEPATDLLPPVGLAERLIFRRVGATLGNGVEQRELLFYESLTADLPEITLAPTEVDSIEQAMLSRTINRGIDNVFNNEPPNDQDTRNNIERIDYLISAPGVQVAAADVGDVGFLILERGGISPFTNDPFSIAAITSIDGAGDPLTYGPLVPVLSGDWGPPNANIGVRFQSFVVRKDQDDPPIAPNPSFRPSHPVPEQNVRGIFFPINSLLEAPANTQPFFGFSLFEADLPAVANLVTLAGFRLDTNGNSQGGLDLIAGGFGLIRRTTIAPAGSLSLLKRITNLFGPANLPNFNQFVGDGAALTLLQNNNLGQGLDVITDPAVQAGNGIEYTVYLANSSTGTAANAVVCDQIPVGLTFAPNGYGPGLGIQAIAASSPPGPVVNYTNAADGDPGTFFAPGAALPPFCGTNQGNGAVVVNAANVAANQVGFIRFRTTVD